MKKIIAKIKNAWRKASCLLAAAGLLALAGLLGAQPVLRPMPVRVERIYRRK